MREAGTSEAGSTLNGSRALVTGGLGFIGSRLALRLSELGAHVTVLDNMMPDSGANPLHVSQLEGRADIRIGDIRDLEAVTQLLKGQDFLFNLAALISHMDSMRQPLEDLDVNARGQINILDCCREVNPDLRIVHASTRQVYGRARELPVTENHPLTPPDVNGINKLAGESFFRLYHDVYGIPTTILRLTNTYGPGMRIRDGRQTFMGVWFRAILTGTAFQVWEGSQVRDLVFVDDAVDAFCRAAEDDSAIGRIFNVGGAEPMTLRALADELTLSETRGRYSVVEYPPDRRPIEIGDFVTDSSRITASLGWTPRTRLREGIQQTLDYYERHMAQYV